MRPQEPMLTLLGDGSRGGVYHCPPARRHGLTAAATGAGWVVVHIDLKGLADKHALLQRLATTLRLPDWFGYNWDALADCLTDLSWLPAKGYLILLEGGADLAARRAADYRTLLEVFAAAAAAWREAGVPFWVLSDRPGDGLPCPGEGR